jgi:hypothetical protein
MVFCRELPAYLEAGNLQGKPAEEAWECILLSYGESSESLDRLAVQGHKPVS